MAGMRNYIIRRCLESLIVLKCILVVIFLILHATGDPVLLLMPEDATPEQIERFRVSMGFDQPLYVQYAQFFIGVLRFDFGTSFFQGQPAMDLVLDRMPATVELSLAALAISLLISIPAGILSALKPNTRYDYASMTVALFGQSVPNFWLGLMLILFFSIYLDLLPTSGTGGWDHLILPAITCGLYSTARITRMIRSGMLEVMNQEYINVARSKGLLERVVVMKHALRNASIPVVTLVGMELGILLGGTVVTEMVFGWPGVGRLTVQSIYNNDFPVVQAAVFLLAFIFVFINLAVDLIYSLLDPRVRLE